MTTSTRVHQRRRRGMEIVGQVITDGVRKRVLVLSDNDGLSRAIKVTLNHCLDVEVIKLAPNPLGERGAQASNGDFDLMVVAMSSPTNEPVLALARASLASHVGRVPLLIISDRPFDSDPEDRVVHLDFPFEIDGLCQKVQEMLSS